MVKRHVLRDPYSKSQQSRKLAAKKIGPFAIEELVSKNAGRLKLPESFRAHLVVNVTHTEPYYAQPEEISSLKETPRPAVDHLTGPEEYVEKILQHRKRGRGWQFLVKWENKPAYESAWIPTRNFISEDGTPTAALME